MDFGVVGYDGLVGSDTTTTTTGFATSDPITKHKWYGSHGFLKQERSGNINIEDDDDWRSSKMVKTSHNHNHHHHYHEGEGDGDAMLIQQQRNNNSTNNYSLLRSNSSTISFDQGQQHHHMLSFSSPKSDAASVDKGSENPALSYYHLASPAYTRNTGYNWGSMNMGGNMHGMLLGGGRGSFTPSQWMELEHQALIYKYINANVPIPSNLLMPIRKALESAAFSGFSGGLLRSNTLGWGPFHLGFSSNSDPEPGRCRRTDGKKWRCSRDAVTDQKYCERHMNRGRHRSRKPVEGQSGHSVAATSTTNNSKLVATSSSSVVVMPSNGGGGGAASSNLTTVEQQQQQLKNLHASGALINRMFLNRDNNVDARKQENSYLISKQQYPFEESMRSEFGLVSSDSLLNPSHNSSLLSCRNFGSSQNLPNQENEESQHSVRQFMDEWPKLEIQSERTQLSISIPVPSPPSNDNNKLTLSPLRLSREFDPIQMGLGVGSVLNEQNQRQANRIPISWESSMGGPLGEVLNHTNNINNNNTSNNNTSRVECKNSSALNLMTEGWDNSPRLSPTGVLQKTAFGSLSNSSAGSSPRAENNNKEQ